MAVLTHFLKNKPDDAGRPPALDRMSPEELAALAEDPDRPPDARAAAVERLPYGELLNRLAFEDSVPRIQKTARRRIAGLIDNNELNFDRFRADASDTFAVLSVAGLSSQAKLLEQYLDSLDDETIMSKLAAEGEPVALRQMAAERVQSADALNRLLKRTRGRDKTVYRIVKQKIDAIKKEEKEVDETQARAERLCAAAERHARLPFDQRYADKTRDLRAQWQALPFEVAPETAQHFSRALELCQGKIDEQQRIAEEQALRQKALDQESAERRGLQSQVQDVIVSLYTADQVDEPLEQQSREQLARLREAWQAAQAHAAAGTAETKTFERLCDGVESMLEALETHGSLHDALKGFNEQETGTVENVRALKSLLKPARLLPEKDKPDIVKHALDAIREREQVEKQQKEAQRRQIRSIGALLRKAEKTLQQGHIRQAFGIRKSLERKLGHADALPASLARQLEALDESLDKLQDWRDYAVQPKKEELVQRMEALVGADTEPQALARQIKTLQEQWRDVSKGGHDDRPELWERFHEAGQKAYEPCRQYFEQRAEARYQNLENRRKLVEQLKTYYHAQDWEAPDWKGAEKVVQTALADWRKFSPTDRSDTKPVQAEFDKVIDDIRQQLAREYEKNIGIKQALIQRAEKLAEQDDARQAAEEIKALQSQWTHTGITPRNQDRKLWKAFRRHCDAVFARLDEVSAAHKAELDQTRKTAESLCREAEKLCELTGRELVDARSELERLRGRFDNIDGLPRPMEKKIRDRFRRAGDRFEKRLGQERRAAKSRRWDQLLAAADAVRRYELALTDGADADSALTEARQSIEEVEDWPSGGQPLIERRLAEAHPLTPDEFEHNETELRKLCIRAEIRAGRESPEQDKDLRMEYQLQQLQQGLGGGTAGGDDIESLTLAWVGVGAVRSEIYNSLLERFNTCRRKGG